MLRSTVKKATRQTAKSKAKPKTNTSKDYLSRQKQKSIFKMIRRKQDARKKRPDPREYRTRGKSPRKMDYSNVESVSRSVSRSGVKTSRLKSSNVKPKKGSKRVRRKPINLSKKKKKR